MQCPYIVPRRFVCVVAVLMFLLGSAHAEEMVEITPRPGVNLRLLVDVPANARAIALLIPGGHGRVLIQDDGSIKGLKGNFLVRMRGRFVQGGVGIAVFDAPTDHADKEGLTYKYRTTPEHAGDIGKAIARLREMFPGRAVWLVGTSRGTISAANAAARPQADGADGLVLTSSVGVANKHEGSVLDFDLTGIHLPVLLLHHRADGCSTTPLSGAQDIRDALRGSKRAELIIVEGGEDGPKPCQGRSHHGFQGIEDKVVDTISAWITGG